jgi:hypothetical protein
MPFRGCTWRQPSQSRPTDCFTTSFWFRRAQSGISRWRQTVPSGLVLTVRAFDARPLDWRVPRKNLSASLSLKAYVLSAQVRFWRNALLRARGSHATSLHSNRHHGDCLRGRRKRQRIAALGRKRTEGTQIALEGSNARRKDRQSDEAHRRCSQKESRNHRYWLGPDR